MSKINSDDNILEKDFNFDIIQGTKNVLEDIRKVGVNEDEIVAVELFVSEFNDLSRFVERKLK